MSQSRKKDIRIFNSIGYVFVTMISLLCLIPFLFVIAGSITSEDEIIKNGYSLIPTKISFFAYRIVLDAPLEILRGYGVTICVTVLGTILGLFITAMTAYVLNRKDFKYRNFFALLFYFTTLFSGGLVSYYIFMVRYLHMKDSFLALVLPLLLNVFYIIIMRSFINSIPFPITESAKIDGAGDFTIFVWLILPLMTPALASIGMFIALGYWNDWFNAMLFIDTPNLYTLQYKLYRILNNAQFAYLMTSKSGVPMPEMPKESIKLALTIISTGPIIFLYPFIQKYFIKGITIGAVKG